METEETAAWDDDGAGGAETTIVPPAATEAAPELAWSLDDGLDEDDDEQQRYSWGDVAERASIVLLIAVAIAISIGLLTWFGFWIYGQVKPVPMPPGLQPPVQRRRCPLRRFHRWRRRQTYPSLRAGTQQ
ncbi:hypothetical protein KXD96_28165 (plasmid) [Mycobacterium sp. SMC-2]|uniref:hypothetical protein n=1 Tax=Mycobacterium sp. SMC-2 TaxID=2857058 RepID=UPI0021B19BAF|nr:hypothetical protein [Mycobacterium sp. SMC-2]UXA09638.1 hypothetical protein KXD96_28165 [Mycobacterium sp. SMC-2]